MGSIAKVVLSPVQKLSNAISSATGIPVNKITGPQIDFIMSVEKTLGKAYNQLTTGLQKMLLAPVANIMSDTLCAVLPDHLAQKLATINEVSLKAFTGKLTVKDINETMKASLQLAALPASMMNEVNKQLVKSADRMTGGLVADLDKYSGGLITSSSNLSDLSSKVYKEEDIDWKATAIDAVKVGAAVVSGGTAVAISTGASYLGEKTGLANNDIFKVGLAATKVYAGGGDVTMFASEYAQDKALKEAYKRGIITETTMKAIQFGLTVSDPQALEAWKEAFVAYAKEELKEMAFKQASKITGISRRDLEMILEADWDALIAMTQNPEMLANILLARAEERMNQEKDKLFAKIQEYRDMFETLGNLDFESLIGMAENAIDSAIEAEKQKLLAQYEYLKDYYTNFDFNQFIEKNLQKLKDEAIKMKDKYIQEAYAYVFALAKKYGMDFLRYLMLKYGPQRNYDKFITSEDQNWQNNPPANTTIPRKSGIGGMVAVVGGLGLLGFLALGD